MPFGNYHELGEEIVKLIGRARYRGEVPGWIELAESEATIALRDLREVRFKSTGVFVAGTDTITLDAGISGIDLFQIDSDPIRVVLPASIHQIAKRRSQTGNDVHPTRFAWINGNTIELAPTPQTTTGYTLYHTKGMVDVNAKKYSSNILSEAPMYLLYRAAFHAYVFMQNDAQRDRMDTISQGLLKTYGQFLARKDKDSLQVHAQTTPQDHPQTVGRY